MNPSSLPIIAVIDDDRASAFALSLLLRDWGYDVIVSGDAVGILKLLNGRILTAIVTDFHLQSGNGVDAGLLIRNHLGSACPVIVVSGSRGGHASRNAWHHDFPLLLKPFEPERLRELLLRLAG